MNEQDNTEIITPGMQIATNATREIVSAEVDIQIATAHRFPRSLATFQKRAKDMVSIDEETAESCIYRRPVGKGQDGKQKIAEGLSIRMAEIVAACYGNFRYAAQIVEQTDRRVIARGMAHDLETNVSGSSECIEGTVTKQGFPYSEGQRNVVAKACLAKARRDAVFTVIPRALCKNIEAEARRIITGSQKPLSQRIEAAMGWLAKIAVEPERVWAVLGIKGPAEIGNEEILTLVGLRTALKDGDITIDEVFPPLETSQDKPKFTKPAPKAKTEPVEKKEEKQEVSTEAIQGHGEPDPEQIFHDLKDQLEGEGIPIKTAAKAMGIKGTVLTVFDLPKAKIEDAMSDWPKFVEKCNAISA